MVTQKDGDERHRREALEWMIAFQEQPEDAALRDRFHHWRQTPEHGAAWQELEHVQSLIRQVSSARAGARSPLAVGRPWRRARVAIPLAAAACFAAMLVGGDVLPSIGADLATGTGEVRTMTLADGSRVTLAPRSAMAFDGVRHARLLRGTAHFDVRHDAAHPFRVVAGDAVATDLGTAFEVGIDGAVTHVSVREGLVALSCTGGGQDLRPLRPGDTEAVDCATGTHRRGQVAPSRVGAWTEGKLVLIDRPLHEAVAALAPWHRGWLIARGAGMTKHVTGVYDLRQPDRALAAMRQAHGLAITSLTPWITIVHAD